MAAPNELALCTRSNTPGFVIRPEALNLVNDGGSRTRARRLRVGIPAGTAVLARDARRGAALSRLRAVEERDASRVRGGWRPFSPRLGRGAAGQRRGSARRAVRRSSRPCSG